MARFIQQGINSARKQFEAHKAQEAARKAEALVLQQQREREAKAQEMERRQKEALERSSKQKSQGRGWSL